MDTISLCLVAPEFLPVWGGTGSYVIELLKNLPKEVEAHVVTLKRQMLGMSHDVLVKNDPKYILGRNVDIHYVSDTKETFFYNLGFQIACFRKIPRLQKEYKFDVLHSQFGHMSDVFLELMRKMQYSTVTTVHGTIAQLNRVSCTCRVGFSDMEWSEKQVRIFYPALRTLELLYARRIQKFIAVSNTTKNQIIEDLKVEPNRVCTVYNGVDTRLFRVPSEDEAEKRFSTPTVVYMGRIMANKGIHVLIEAIPDILKAEPNTHFLFVGAGNVPFYLRTMQKMKIPKTNFSFVGQAGYFDRPRYLMEATVFVNPSFFEHSSLSILEAMSCGASVAASAVGGNPEIITSGKNGILVPPHDSKGLAGAIISLLGDEKYNKKVGKEARKTVENSFSADITARETCNVYRQVLGEKT